MKFLAIAKIKEVFFTLPPPVQLQIIEASLAAMEQQKQAGKVLDFYYSPAGYNITILEYKSAEEWAADQASVPVLSYADHEVYPLTDGFPVLKNSIRNVKATLKASPGPPR
jgi:muconolactone delta-isomerase